MTTVSTKAILLAVLAFALALFSLAIPAYSQSQLQAGYAIITASGGTAPVGTALFSFTNSSGVLVWQAGVGAAEPIRSGRIFVDQQGTRTALALVNPSNQTISVTLVLRNSAGAEVNRIVRGFTPRQHLALFINELFPNVPAGFTGSLTFDTTQNDQKVAAITLRENRNTFGETIYATLPVVDLTIAPGAQSIIFPHVGAGQGFSTQLVLVSRSNQRISGQISLTRSDGTPLQLALNGNISSSFPYQIEPNGTYRAELTSSSTTGVGYAVVTLGQGDAAPSGSAIFQFKSRNSVISEAGVAAITPTTSARIFVDNAATRTGVALASANNPSTTITFNLLDRSGVSIETTSRNIAARGHLAIFADELFPDLPAGFTGLMEIASPVPVAPVTLKLSTNQRNQPILTTLPIADLTRPSAAVSLVFPQIGFGAGFSTRLIFINPDKAKPAEGTLTFYQSSGAGLTVPLGNQAAASQFYYQITAGGGRQFSAGEPRIVIDVSNQAVNEIAVNQGRTIRITPRIVDNSGNAFGGSDFKYSSSSPDIATVDAFGNIQGIAAGFSTLTISTGALTATFTITVVRITSGVAAQKSGAFATAFDVTGIAQDLSGRFYLADTGNHTVLTAENLQQTPVIYAGTDKTPGLKDDVRSQSLLRSPAFLTFNQYDGSLFVSDSGNNVIRLIRPGPEGRVEILAGTGRSGSQDGPANQATFSNPQGIVLDNRGNLLVVDSGNHTIRRINLITRNVETIAGKAGSTGLTDGSGQSTRFYSPIGIALEDESLADQLKREKTGAPPPPLSFVLTDTGNNLVRRIKVVVNAEDPSKETIEVETVGSSSKPQKINQPLSPATATTFNSPTGIAVDSLGNIYVSETNSRQVRTILQNGKVVGAAQENTFAGPKGITITQSGKVLVADKSNSGQEISYGQPSVSGITPDRVSNKGGARVTIKGKNFAPDTLVVVADDLIRGLEIIDTETLSFAAPQLPSGRTTVTVQNRGGLFQRSWLIDALPVSQLSAGQITTVAGGTTFAGDGGAATSATLGFPWGIALDASGNLFIADRENYRVRRVSVGSRIITTVAGTGTFLSSGDNGPATAASFGFVRGIAVDAAGNLFIAVDNRIRKVTAATGRINTIAGNGAQDFYGDNDSATKAALNNPTGIAVDAFGNVFIADTFNHVIRKVAAQTGIITTVAGSGKEGFSGDGGLATAATLRFPTGVAVDAKGNLFIADTDNHRIRKVAAGTGIISTVAGNSQSGFSGDNVSASATSLFNPWGIAVDANSNLLIGDTGNHRIRRVSAATGIITTVAGNGQEGFSGDNRLATDAALAFPRGIAVDAGGNIFISDTGNNRIRKFIAGTGIIVTVAGSVATVTDNMSATVATLSQPAEMAVDSARNLYIADTFNDRIRRVDAITNAITTVAGGGNPADGVGDNGPATSAALNGPYGITVDNNANLFVVDTFHHRIRKVAAATGTITTVAGNGKEGFSGDNGAATSASLDSPTRIALDTAGNLYIADTSNSRIRKVTATNGTITTVAGGSNPTSGIGDNGPATAAALSYPWGIAIDAAGNLFIADAGNALIRKVAAGTGIITTVAGGGTDPEQLGDFGPATSAFMVPYGVTVDAAGNLYIADKTNHRIRKMNAKSGTIATVAGSDNFGFLGDNSPATDATFAYPTGVVLDRSGNLLVADRYNNRIRAVRGPISDPVPSPPKVNLAPYTPAGWSNPVVPSDVTGTHTTGKLIAGQPTYIDWAVINNGGADITTSITYELRIDGVAQKRWQSDGLKQGFYNFIEDYSVTLSAGSHTLTIVADPDNTIAESNENDNSFTFTGTWIAFVSRVNLTPYTPTGWSNPIVPSHITGTNITGNLIAGQPTYIDWAVTNNGDIDITVPVTYELRIDGVAQNRWYSYDGLKQGFYNFIEDYAVTLPAGQHTITIVADPDNDIVETNESDNSFTFTGTWTTVPVARVNLTPYTPSGWSNPVVPSDLTGTHTTGKLIAGQPTYIDWAVTNNGDADITVAVIYELRIDGVAQKRWQSDGLKQGFYNFVEDYAVTLSAGSHTLTIVADPDNAIAETNENDNSFTFTGNWTATGNGANLVPYTPVGWSNPVVPSDAIGTHTTGNLIAGKPTYIDWAVANDGNVDITVPAIYDLRIDGVPQKRWESSDGLKQGFYASVEDFAVTLSAGVHTITIVADPDNTIAETNESDNSFTFTGTWVLGVGKVTPVP